MRGKPKQGIEALLERIARDGGRAVIYRLAPSVGGLKLQTVGHLLVETNVQSIIEGVGCPIDVPDNPVGLVNLRIDCTPSGLSASRETRCTKSVACLIEAAWKQ